MHYYRIIFFIYYKYAYLKLQNFESEMLGLNIFVLVLNTQSLISLLFKHN